MNINDKQDFYNEEMNFVIEPVADDGITVGMDDGVHLIGGEAFGNDAMGDFVMNVDSNGVFDFDVADYGDDALVDDVEILDMNPLDDTGYDDAIVMDVDSNGDFDFAVADVNNDGFIDADDVLDTLDDAASEGYIGYDTAVVVEEESAGEIIEESLIEDEEPPVEEEAIDATEDLYPDDNDIDYITDDILDL